DANDRGRLLGLPGQPPLVRRYTIGLGQIDAVLLAEPYVANLTLDEWRLLRSLPDVVAPPNANQIAEMVGAVRYFTDATFEDRGGRWGGDSETTVESRHR